MKNHVETMKFKTPLDKEYHKQKQQIMKQWCRHLKRLDEVTMINHQLDEIETYYACSMCGAILLPKDLQQRELELLKFHNPLKSKK
jgi:hypothetical protein